VSAQVLPYWVQDDVACSLSHGCLVLSVCTPDACNALFANAAVYANYASDSRCTR